MTALARLLTRLRGPWVADDPAPDLSWLDRADGLGTRYDAEWPDVAAAEIPSGDLAAMAAPLGMARDDLGTYAEPVTVGEWTAPVPFVPMPRHSFEETMAAIHLEPMPRAGLDRILAAIDEMERVEAAFDDGRAYEAGTRCRTEAAATKRAAAYLADGEDGARRAALVLAGYAGADMWAVSA
jgi:hypothetical protein